MEEIRTRQVTGKMGKGEGTVPPLESTPSCEATMYGEMKRGTKFDDPLHDITKEGPMEPEHTSNTR